MTTKELLEVLGNTKSAKAFELARNPPPPPKLPPPPAIDWEKRKMEKNKIMLKYLKVMIGCFVGIMIFFVAPVFLAYPDVGRSLLLGMPPMVFVALSWMGGAWYAWDKDQYIFLALTLGAMPIRLGVGLMWSVLVYQMPNINQTAFVLGMMLFWIAFTIPEFAMLIEFGKKFSKDGVQNEV